jgi:hypothetical protein
VLTQRLADRAARGQTAEISVSGAIRLNAEQTTTTVPLLYVDGSFSSNGSASLHIWTTASWTPLPTELPALTLPPMDGSMRIASDGSVDIHASNAPAGRISLDGESPSVECAAHLR